VLKTYIPLSNLLVIKSKKFLLQFPVFASKRKNNW